MALNLSEKVNIALDYIKSIDVSEIKDELEAGRAFYEKFIPMAGKKETVYSIENIEIESNDAPIPIRIYRPNKEKKLPAVLYFHGGWFIYGSLETHDTPLRQLANLSEMMIIAVDYRLAPEHPFPNGLNDCFAALDWIVSNAETLGIDIANLAIAGDSAGGALAATLTNKISHESKIKLACQVLIYPVTDASLTAPSWNEFKEGLNLTLEGGIQAWNLYLQDNDQRTNCDAIPLLAANLKHVPPTLMILAEFDPLRDEGLAYAKKLKMNNVKVQESLYEGMIHGFFQMGGILKEGNQAIAKVATFLKKNLNN